MLVMLEGSCVFPEVRETPPPADAPAEEVALAGAAVLLGAGDIATCEGSGDEATARLVDSVLKADSAAGVEDYVFTTGDNAYPSGRERDFAVCFGASWGDTAKRIMKWIHPSPGNHEHESARAAPYYKYFGERVAGSAKLGYYSYDLGEWHVVVLNSVIAVGPEGRIFSAAERRAQEEWLREDLRSKSKKCTVAYWHHALFSSTRPYPEMRRLFQILYEENADLVIAGHDHHYERFRPQSASGLVDTARGIPQIIVGTGGGELRGIPRPYAPNSVVQIEGHFGVLKLTFGAAEWRSAFIDISGRIWDRTGDKCH
jgi:acid phosphatase type 7